MAVAVTDVAPREESVVPVTEEVSTEVVCAVEAVVAVVAVSVAAIVVVVEVEVLPHKNSSPSPRNNFPMSVLPSAVCRLQARCMDVCADFILDMQVLEQDPVPPIPRKSLSSQSLTGASYAAVHDDEKPMMSWISENETAALENWTSVHNMDMTAH